MLFEVIAYWVSDPDHQIILDVEATSKEDAELQCLKYYPTGSVVVMYVREKVTT